ncbi:unnamed protein product [Lasius platythorax]|uniref:Uncharacterized protein n=1 Tax=Lasius platythorax TaxID=488582 RepID=A0AAV2NDB9_9HYME
MSESRKDPRFWLEIPGSKEDEERDGGSLERRISGTRVAAAARQGRDPTQTARPQKIEMFGCLNVGVLSQHSSFHPSFPRPSLPPSVPALLFVSVPLSRDTRDLPGGSNRSRIDK